MRRIIKKILKESNIGETLERSKWVSPNGEVFKVGDIIDGCRLDELSGYNVGGDKEKYRLIHKNLSEFPYSEYNRQVVFEEEPDYIEEETYRFDWIKDNFNETPPIPMEGDGFHRIVVAKELGHKTILMWQKITE